MSHTKGEWVITKQSNISWLLYSAHDNKDTTDIAMIWKNCQQSEANARLISKAPEMLELLKHIMDYCTIIQDIKDERLIDYEYKAILAEIEGE